MAMTLITPEPTRKKAVRENNGMYLTVSQSFSRALFPASKFSGFPVRYSSALHFPITSRELRMGALKSSPPLNQRYRTNSSWSEDSVVYSCAEILTQG